MSKCADVHVIRVVFCLATIARPDLSARIVLLCTDTILAKMITHFTVAVLLFENIEIEICSVNYYLQKLFSN